MAAIEQTVLEMFNHLIQRHPQFAREFERIAATAQGKGYGAATVEQEVKLVLELLARQPLLAIDVGGNIGDYTAQLRQTHPELEIHVFEPSKTNTAKLAQRFASDSRVTLCPVALSDSEGSTTLFSNEPGSALASLTQRRLDYLHIDFSTQEVIDTVRFETYWETRLGGRPLDIVKIDVEGHEIAVLKGFGKALAATRVLQFEFGGANIDTRTFFRDFWYLFTEQQFALYRITPHGAEAIPAYRESDEFFTTTNYIALNLR